MASFLVIVLLSILGIVVSRQLSVSSLAKEAADPGVSSQERLRDVGYLASISGRQSAQSLVAIAIDDSVPFDSRNAAVAALKERKDPSISSDLARLLQPQNAESLRHAVADTLVQIPCSADCARYILHYLERMWRGDTNSEDLVTDSAPTAALEKLDPQLMNSEATQFREQQKQLVSELENVLSKNQAETLTVLRNVYGLGSFHPSYFALYMVEELRFPAACPDLERPQLEEIVGEKMASQIREVRDQVCASR